MSDGRVIAVEIHGQRYPIRSSLDPEYVLRLAAYVDQKIACGGREHAEWRLAAAGGAGGAEHRRRTLPHPRSQPRRDTQIAERASELEQLVDRVLMA